ncbi:hypothetical protein ACFU9Y_03980 [Streptomyces sp. NPDC057621]|uniref:hypothetical protein n=1 Tax=Streptomyces sp. NPDC057621 TaxID=3346186 RepID=UPI0036A55824
MTPRRLRVLINGLPSDSLYRSKVGGITDGQRWGLRDSMLANIHDLLVAQFGVAYVGVTHKQPPKIDAFPRPTFASGKTREDAQANARAEEYLELLSSGALAGQEAPGAHRWINGIPADRQTLRSGTEQLPETGGATTT